MRRTLFWYVFKDLLRIFFLTSGALAGIMSFGGLLKDITDRGLDVGQVVAILRYSMPAMTTYSLPIAALFATTVVYGRLAADNEITAMRAAGIGFNPFTGIAAPAMWLGLSMAICSLLLLCFIVPVFMLKVERVIFSNVGQIVSNEIEKNHQLKFQQGDMDVTVYAHSAQVQQPDPSRPSDQIVTLISPMVVTYESQKKGEDKPKVPKDFFMSSFANIRIERNEKTDEIYVTVQANGTKFPRNFAGAEQAGVDVGAVQGLTYPSPVRENTKFMDIFRLQYLLKDPSDSRKVKDQLRAFIRADQQSQFLDSVLSQLNSPTGVAKLDNESEHFTLERGGATATITKDRSQLNLVSHAGQREIRLTQDRKGQVVRVEAARARMTVIPDADQHRLAASVTLEDAAVRVGSDEEASPREAFARDINLPMPASIQDIENRTIGDYTKPGSILPDRQRALYRAGLQLSNSIVSEIHSRLSFAFSCWILVMVGCALGIMFRSGNFLNAFAVSVVPALISIALIITGQHTCENLPPAHQITSSFSNPLNLGLALIWSGNAVVAVIALALIGKLQRQ
jgi:lipopolysaccharide export LptBFGC system permease protein LptF